MHKLLSLLLSATALIAISVGQAAAQSVRVPLQTNGKTVGQVLDMIEENSDYAFLYKESEIDPSKEVAVTVGSTAIKDILSEIFKGTDVVWNIVDRQIVLSVKSHRDGNQAGETRNITVSGVVSDDTGMPLIGAGVLIKGTTSGTTTDIDGYFSLSVPKGKTVEVSSLGFVNYEFAAESEAPLSITLSSDTEILDEVVVTALGIKRTTKALSYNVQEVASEKITAVKDPNFMNSLSGKIAGVNINASANGPGGAARVVMRGVKSISKSNQALYVVDGVPVSNSGGDIGSAAGGGRIRCAAGRRRHFGPQP